MKRLLLRAPAKVNLGLRILARRHDGYHEIESVFAPLDLADEVAIEIAEAPEPRASLELREAVEGVPTDAANLALRAAERFLAAARLRCAVHIQLHKRVPVAAGLGGGSSDAGSVLRGLATLCPDAVAPEDLARIALDLGADVPFFLDPGPCFVGGIGEEIEPLPPVAGLTLLLANPGVPVSTAAVYRAFDALRPALAQKPASPTLRPLSGRWREVTPPSHRSAAELQRLLTNDLEPAAVRLCPPIGRLRERLREIGALAVGMSGSGATLFGVFEDAVRAAAARDALAPAHGERRTAAAWSRVATTVRSR